MKAALLTLALGSAASSVAALAPLNKDICSDNLHECKDDGYKCCPPVKGSYFCCPSFTTCATDSIACSGTQGNAFFYASSGKALTKAEQEAEKTSKQLQKVKLADSLLRKVTREMKVRKDAPSMCQDHKHECPYDGYKCCPPVSGTYFCCPSSAHCNSNAMGCSTAMTNPFVAMAEDKKASFVERLVSKYQMGAAQLKEMYHAIRDTHTKPVPEVKIATEVLELKNVELEEENAMCSDGLHQCVTDGYVCCPPVKSATSDAVFYCCPDSGKCDPWAAECDTSLKNPFKKEANQAKFQEVEDLKNVVIALDEVEDLKELMKDTATTEHSADSKLSEISGAMCDDNRHSCLTDGYTCCPAVKEAGKYNPTYYCCPNVGMCDKDKVACDMNAGKKANPFHQQQQHLLGEHGHGQQMQVQQPAVEEKKVEKRVDGAICSDNEHECVTDGYKCCPPVNDTWFCCPQAATCSSSSVSCSLEGEKGHKAALLAAFRNASPSAKDMLFI